MKKSLGRILGVLMCCSVIVACQYDDSEIKDRLKKLEGTTIKTIEEQISGINNSIISINSIQAQTDNTIKSLQAKDTELAGKVSKVSDDLSKSINTLQKYVDSLTVAKTDWVSASFSTLDQYYGVLSQLTTLDEMIDTVEVKLSTKIEDEIVTMTSWVNEKLTGYYDIATTEAKLKSLQLEMFMADSISLKEIESLKEQLQQIEKITSESDSLIQNTITALVEQLSVIQNDLTEANEYATSEISKLSVDLASLGVTTSKADSISLKEIESLKEQLQQIKITTSASDSLMQNKITAIVEQLSVIQNDMTEANEYATSEISKLSVDLASLGVTTSKADSLTLVEIAQLKEDLDSTKVQLTRSYQKAIEDAIETNNGTINKKIETEIETVNKRIDKEVSDISDRISKLEGRIETLEKEYAELSKVLAITFSDNDISCSDGDIITVGYTITNDNGNANIFTLGENGWAAKVNKQTATTGTITVNAPSPLVNGNILVFVNEGNKSIISSLNFIAGTMTVSAEAILADSEGDTVTVDIDTDLQYTIQIEDGVTWIHNATISTRSAMRYESASFYVDENLGTTSRAATVCFVNPSGVIIKQITIRQSASIILQNEIWYKTTDGLVTSPTRLSFGANIISNTYGKKGVIVFDKKISRIGYEAFANNNTIREFSIPEGVTLVDSKAFYNCNNLITANLPNSVKSIGESAFSSCSRLSSIELGDSLEIIGKSAFYGTNLVEIVLPENVNDIGTEAFSNCSSLCNVQFGDSLRRVQNRAFSYCEALSQIALPNSVESIGDYAFSNSGLIEIELPSKIKRIADYLFFGCSKLTSVTLSDSTFSIGAAAFSGCKSISSITIPNTVENISYRAFEDCISLSEIYMQGYPIQFIYDISGLFANQYLEEMTLFVPKGLKSLYENADTWKDFGSIVEIDSVKIPEPEYVDLGLSVKWATCNLGAVMPKGRGYYFAWGETTPKTKYKWNTYKYSKDSDTTITKYCNKSNNGYGGYMDNLSVLDLADDAASVILGGCWRIPTIDEIKELTNHDNCSWVWVSNSTFDGDIVVGYKVTSKKSGYEGNSIFLPASGMIVGTNLNNVNSGGHYWSSSLFGDPSEAQFLSFGSTHNDWYYSERVRGMTIRPVHY